MIKTVEEKAKAYDEIIEKANKMHCENCEACQICIEELIPELAESEDERIRKELIKETKGSEVRLFETVTNDEFVAWLEKQGKKPADKVEPNFKVGDWIVFNGLTLYIKEVVKGYYRTISKGGMTDSYDWDIDNAARLWNLKEAKDGDVLAFDSDTIVIFKDLYNATSFHSYCHIEDGVFTASEEGVPDWWEGEGFNPATKKQRDILLKAMTDAGYKWDADAKVLKEIEQKNVIDIPFGAKDGELLEASYRIPEDFHAEIKDNKVFIKKGEQNPAAWSEEDEKVTKWVIDYIGNCPNESFEYYGGVGKKAVLSWLNKLKGILQPQPQWKPSELQIEALESATENCAYSEYQDCLRELIGQLKKLKE